MSLSVLERIFSGYFYIQVKPNCFVVQNLATDEPPVTLHAKNNFTSKRLLISNYENAYECLNQYFKRSFLKSLVKPTPMILLHPEKIFDDEFSEVEKQSFTGIAFEVGARQVYLWEGDVLSKEEALTHLQSQKGQ